jgi:predicted short-subunit dehydrogenase-like oxidoreductase (DUF2520 family)
MRARLIGSGRAGSSFQIALGAAGIDMHPPLHHDDEIAGAANDADLVILAVPDGAIGEVADAIEPGEATVIHLSGATTLAPLRRHPSRGSLHPLVSLTGGERGSEALRGASFAVAWSDTSARQTCRLVIEALGGSGFDVDDDHRSAYHATAAVAANHLVALCAQIERLAGNAAVPAEVFWPLMRGVLDGVAADGAAPSLTGPVQRGDWGTVRAHLAAIGSAERELYLELARAAARLAGQTVPDDLVSTTSGPKS